MKRGKSNFLFFRFLMDHIGWPIVFKIFKKCTDKAKIALFKKDYKKCFVITFCDKAAMGVDAMLPPYNV